MDYTINGNAVHRRFMRLCERHHLRPSRWLPRFPAPEGIYLRFTGRGRDGEERVSYGRFFDGYHFCWVVCSTWRIPVLTRIFGQLFETNVGLYDWIDESKFVPVSDAERARMKDATLQFPEHP